MAKMNTLIKPVRFVLARAGFLLYLGGNLILHFFFKNWFGRLILLTALAAVIGLTYFAGIFSEVDPEAQPKVSIQIPAGASFRQVADSLDQYQLLRSKQLFLLMGKVSGKERNVKAGVFAIPTGLSDWQLLDYLEGARAAQIKVTLPEGILSDKMASILQEKIGIDSTRFVHLVNDIAFSQSLIGGPSLEGYLQPETYYFEWKTPEKKLIEYLVGRTLEIFEPDSVQKRLSQMGWTRHDIVTLAAIVEGEAIVDSERVDIAALYHNRLRKGWRLQADPTIQFAIPGPPKRLLYKDLEIDSPYNTYKYAGLPPGPINNPGKKSILATLYPSSVAYLYMVAVGDGSHKFSMTLREHNYWHKRFNEVRRRVRREQRQRQAQ